MQSKDILTKVAEQISAVGSAGVVGQVVKKLADTEVTRRADALYHAIKLVDECRRELNKLRPDQQQFGPDHKLVGETYSKATMEKRKKLEERTAKLEGAINKATEGDTPDYNVLFNMAKEPLPKDDKSGDTNAGQPASDTAQ
jgi:hypothetical protein